MSSWTPDMMPLRDVMRSAVEITALQLGLNDELSSFKKMCDEYDYQPPYPLAIDMYLADYKMGGSNGMSSVLPCNNTETPIQYVAERLITEFIRHIPSLYIFRSGSKEKIDIEEMMGYDSLPSQHSDIPFKHDEFLIVVPIKKWESFKREAQVLSDEELIEKIANLGLLVTKSMAENALKPLIGFNKNFAPIWEKAKVKHEHVGIIGRPKKLRKLNPPQKRPPKK